MAYIDIDLDRVDADDLIEALSNHYLNNNEQQQLLELVKAEASTKMQFFLKIMDKFSLFELEEMFKEKTVFNYSPIPKEQLKLVFES